MNKFGIKDITATVAITYSADDWLESESFEEGEVPTQAAFREWIQDWVYEDFNGGVEMDPDLTEEED